MNTVFRFFPIISINNGLIIEIPFTVIAMFFAVRVNKAKLPEWVDWILAAYVVFHILTHLILTVRMIFDNSKVKLFYIYLIYMNLVDIF